MFNVRPDLQRLGFHVEPPVEEEVPGLHAWRPDTEVASFRLNADSSTRQPAESAAQLQAAIFGDRFGLLGAGRNMPVADGPPLPYFAYGRLPYGGTGSAPFLGAVPAGAPPRAAAPSSQSPYTLVGHTTGPIASSSPNLPPSALPATRDAWPVVDGIDDPSVVRTTDIQIAQRQATPPVSPATRQEPPPLGRGYVQGQQDRIERGMTPLQVLISRDQAFRELTRQPLNATQARSALPDDWESTKPADLVDEIKRAAERHGVPVQMFARQLYQEGKFNEPDKLKRPLRMDSKVGSDPIGYAQMTKDTFQTLKNRARLRGDAERAEELATYSLADREQSFDAAAEQLAYLHRLMGGSWPKALAAYNYGPGLKKWFDGDRISISKGKWEEIAGYLGYALRGAAEDPQVGDGYALQPPNQAHVRKKIYRPSIPSDTRLNP